LYIANGGHLKLRKDKDYRGLFSFI
jgi:hypothetical protein